MKLRDRILGLLADRCPTLDPDRRVKLAEDIERAVEIDRREAYERALSSPSDAPLTSVTWQDAYARGNSPAWRAAPDRQDTR